MNEHKLEALKTELLKEKKQVQAQLDSMKEGQLSTELGDSVGEFSTYDNHPADLGSEVFERSKDLSLKEGLKDRIDHIEDALNQIEAGTYGKCEMCGKVISDERLEAMPSTTLCHKCKEGTEVPDRHPRPLEEDVIAPPFGGFHHDKSPKELNDGDDENMYDGEDAWQDVSRYGSSESPQDLEGNIVDYQQMVVDGDEDRGIVQGVEGIPYMRGADGMIYEDEYGTDDEEAPREKVIGDKGWDKLNTNKRNKRNPS